ncbi:aminotransferase class IV family protein [uncultured Pelagimonas sp.]|uniref:aminotransferase class IV family protein n=1 Tax=uncultured Pelagimonas sp. TaxID=1618102 RepID=UPI002633E0F8|nr:aminotransferase class IV family protein [uncultured Pelagimonas sp.]
MESPLCPVEPEFRLIETFGYHPGTGFVRLDLHLARLARSAHAFGILFDSQSVRELLQDKGGETALRCRLTLARDGALDLTTAPLAENPPAWRLQINSARLDSTDPWLRHKTTRRALYDKARAALPKGIDELLFLNERDELCEGTITNLFVTTQDGLRLTPPLTSGLLPGILRQSLLAEGDYQEGTLTLSDLRHAQSIFVGNSLRGLIMSTL